MSRPVVASAHKNVVLPAFLLVVECVDDEFACHILCMWKLCLH